MAYSFISREGLEKLVELTKASLNEKVDVVAGKGLSTNDFTDALKAKLDSLDSDAINASIKSQIDAAVGHLTGLSFVVPEDGQLPAQGETGCIYLLPTEAGENNAYEEYVWIGDSYEVLGSTNIDLSTKVDKVEGMGLSANNLTDELLGQIKKSVPKDEMTEITADDVTTLWG